MAQIKEQTLIDGLGGIIEQHLQPLVQFLVHLRVPVTIAIASYFVFSQVDQTIEIYRSVALDRRVFQAIIATLSVTLLSLLIWYSARLLQVYKYDKSTQEEQKPQYHKAMVVELANWLSKNLDWMALFMLVIGALAVAQGFLAQFVGGALLVVVILTLFIPQDLYAWIPRILAILPLISLSLGIHQAQKSLDNTFLSVWLWGTLVITGVLFILLINRKTVFEKIFKIKALATDNKAEGLFGARFENWFVNTAFSIFCVFAVPLIVAATGTTWSWGIAAVLGLFIVLLLLLLLWHQEQRRNKELNVYTDEMGRKEILAVASLSLVTFIVSWLGLPQFLPASFFPNAVGSVGVVALSLSILVVVFSTIYNWGHSTKIPGITALLILAVLASSLNWNDNHKFRQLLHSEPAKLPSLQQSFSQWLASRPDKAQFAGKPYPVYLAAAQGGGIYAAYHAATTFAKLTEYAPNFPQHVFAISSVSGGSLGASAYASLVKIDAQASATPDPRPLSQRAKQLFDQDLLSPLLTMGLFPDLIQRFIPFSIYDWDRGAALEVAFENAWHKLYPQASQNPLQASFYQHWQPIGIAPALVLNTTVVETGERLVFSPFQIALPNQENNQDTVDNETVPPARAEQATIVLNEPKLDLRLSTAAGLSARFPFVTPAGWYQRSSDQNKLRLVDGGYFDNSGIPTALDIGRGLQKLPGYGKDFEIFYLSLIDQPSRSTAGSINSEGLNEVASPLRALFNARESRSRSANQLTTFTVNDRQDPMDFKFKTLFLAKSGDNIQEIESNLKKIKLPLGWLLSDLSQSLIDVQMPEPSQCQLDQFRNSYKTDSIGTDVLNHNRCVTQSIQKDLEVQG